MILSIEKIENLQQVVNSVILQDTKLAYNKKMMKIN
jgi:hypothetical protein